HGPTAQQQCEACHTLVDERSHRFELTEAPPDLCYICHDPIQESEFMHGPVALGTCTVCHDPHGAPNQFMLPEPGGELCFMCHSEMGTHVSSARVPHGAMDEQGCSACHDPHGASFRYQLKADMPDLCLDCHEPVAEIIATAVVAHDPVHSDKQCVNCHNPHGSDVPMILAAREMDLCLDCHDRPMDTPHGPIIDMQSWIAENPERHGPIRDRSCTGCHQPHGSENFRILKHEFPREFYRPFALETYDLCFQCHEETLVLDERTTTLTGFRNGDKNLHYLHVNQEKGRTCRACHEIHAGTKPKRIKDFVPFGNWQYPVNFEMSEFGGRCAPGCHRPRSYDRRQEIIQE
ncbi:MAG: cytochrome c3 family protein, partial [Planctomycetota bacterium]